MTTSSSSIVEPIASPPPSIPRCRSTVRPRTSGGNAVAGTVLATFGGLPSGSNPPSSGSAALFSVGAGGG
ncbi:MAG: hypothetical protein ACKOF7_02750, partial [Phycisphaerales bacterium]